jgi:hypothetical protein
MNVFSIVMTIVVIVLILILLRWLFSDTNTLQSLQSAQTASVISASSLPTNGSNVPSSNFAYSIWFYINDWNYRYGETKVVFGRMGAKSDTNSGSIQGVSGLDPCPAVVLGAVENNISVSLGCYPGIDQQPTTPGGNTVVHNCEVPNIPIQKWVNFIVNVYGRSMDIYIDGKLVRTCLLPGVASVNNSANVYVTPSGGFNGWTSKFQYYPSPINPQQAWTIYSQGYSNWYSNFNSYQLQISVVENGTTQKSVTI